MSFLQRLKGKGVRENDGLLSDSEETAADKIAQLHVDVYQTERMVVVYAQCAGADMEDVHVSIEGDADIVLIEGRRTRPEHIAFPRKKVSGAFVAEECEWGEFYRRIILPESVNIDEADAKIKYGVLVLTLPLLKASEKSKVTLKVGSSKPKTASRMRSNKSNQVYSCIS